MLSSEVIQSCHPFHYKKTTKNLDSKSALLTFNAMTLLVGRQEWHPACKKTEWWVPTWLSVWGKVQICIWPS